MKSLMIVNSHYQLLVALQMAKTLLNSQDTDLLIADHSKGLKDVGERLAQTEFFHRVYLIDNYSKLKNRALKEKLRHAINLGFGRKSAFYLPFLEHNQYDALYYFNFDYQTMAIAEYFLKRNPQLQLNKFEEGLFSYEEPSKIQSGLTVVLIDILRKMSFQINWDRNKKFFYCFFPDYAKERNIGNYQVCGISKIDKNDEEYKGIIRNIYQYQKMDCLKGISVVYFASAYDVDELALLDRLADKYGKDRIIVKPHPRKGAKIFLDAGYKLMETIYPWEVIQLNENVDQLLLVSINSSSVLLANAIFGDRAKGMLLYPLVKDFTKGGENKYIEYINNNISEVLNYFHQSHLMENVQAVDRID